MTMRASIDRSTLRWLVLGAGILLLLLPCPSYSQSADGLTAGATTEQSDNMPKNTSVKEDINEFLGYEDLLLVRYLSLPYDAVMGTNMVSYFVDIGFVFLALLPLIYFWSSSGVWWHRLGVIVLLLVFLILAVPSAFMNRQKISLDQAGTLIDSRLAEPAQDPLLGLAYYGKKMFLAIYQGINPVLEKISGPTDRITYPVLFALLAVFLFLLEGRTRAQSPATRAILHFVLIYGFLWVLLSSGIPWYGLLLFPLLILMVVRGATGANSADLRSNLPQKLILGAMTILWLWMAIPYRFANYEPTDEVKAKLPFMASVSQYQTGQIDRDQVFDRIFPRYRSALEYINQEKDSYVYRVGTLMPFFIQKNDRRVFSDNFLDFFQNLQQEFPNPQELAVALRAYGFRYIVIDLNLPVNDNTPEGSLKTKFQNFMNFIYQNPQLVLVATDRVVRNAQGQVELRVFPDGDQVENLGWFAVYQLL
jgi:hypothetical protein